MNRPALKLQLRAFTSVLMVLTFAALLATGMVLFMAPPGRVANWTGWHVLGLTKHDWGDLHITFGALFLVAGLGHLLFNLRPLLNCFKHRITRRVGFRPEWIGALILCGLVFAGTRAGMPPFSALLALNERLKQSWQDARTDAPVPHAELMTVSELAARADVPLETAVQRLTDRGLSGVGPEVVVAELAGLNKVSAQQVYETLCAARTSTGGIWGAGMEQGGRRGEGSGGGAGRMTLAEFCVSRQMDVGQAQALLQGHGIRAEAGNTLREIALANGRSHPHEIVTLLEQANPAAQPLPPGR